MKNWNVRKTIVAREDMPEEHRLKQSLSWPHLVALGVGAIVGTGILALIGVGAGKAGPGGHPVLRHRRRDLRLRGAGLCRGGDDDPRVGLRLHLFLRRVRRADRLDDRLVADPRIYPGRQRGRGRLVGLCAGSSTVRSAFPERLATGPSSAASSTSRPSSSSAVVAGLLIAGTRESATLNAHPGRDQDAGAGAVHRRRAAASSTPPTSIRSCPTASPSSGPSGREVGVMAAAAIIFFAFYGFDAIATAAEEAKNPSRDLAIGIVGSMVVCVLIYMAVAAAAIGAVALSPLRQQPRAAGADPARHRPAAGPRKILGASAVIALADRHPRLLLRAEPDLLHHVAATACCRAAWRACRAAERRCGSPSSRRS